MPSSITRVASLEAAWEDVDSSFERFCLTAGIGAMEQMLCEDAPAAHRGAQHPQRARQPRFHGGKVAVHATRMQLRGP